MNHRRRFLQMVGGSVVAAGFGCGTQTSTTSSTSASTSSGSTGSGMGGMGSTGSGPNCGAGGAANEGTNNDICQSNKGRFNVGTPADYASMGLHKSKNLDSNVLIGRDADGLYALSSLCTHQCCDMNGTLGGQQVGTILSTGIRCNCHGSDFDALGNPATKFQPAKQKLASYGLSLGCDGSLYADTTTTVPDTQRLMA